MMKYGYLEVATQKTEEELLESDKLLSDEQLREALVKNNQHYVFIYICVYIQLKEQMHM